MTDLENKIGYHFKNKDLLSEALTHSSYANERKAQHIKYNERLEFLGDAVLSIVVSDYIFSHCPELPEGELTKLRASLVCEKSLFEFAKKIDLGSYLVLSKGERNNGGAERPSILSDAFEALIAAIYIDGGMEPAARTTRRPCRRSSRRTRVKSSSTSLSARAAPTTTSTLSLRYISTATSSERAAAEAKRKPSSRRQEKHWS